MGPWALKQELFFGTDPWRARNEVNEFGFTPLTLDFEAFVRFIRQVSWKPVTC